MQDCKSTVSGLDSKTVVIVCLTINAHSALVTQNCPSQLSQEGNDYSNGDEQIYITVFLAK